MAASPNDPRTKRRAAAGDDVNKMAMAPQPIPGMPQDQKGGNSMNYPAFDSQGQMGQKMGSGGGMMPYGDMMADAAQQEALGNIGFVERSNVPQNIVPGRTQNAVFAYNAQPQPDPQQMSMMEPLYDMNSAVGKTMTNGLNNGQPPSYNVTALGPTGTSNVPGNIPVMNYQMPDSLGLQGGTSGMSTGRGGGRNKGKN